MKVYIIQDYDTVVYAGTSKKDAIAKVKGNGMIQVWHGGKLNCYLKYSFKHKKWIEI